MSFRLLFLALVFATISLVCFGDQEKKVGKSSCFGVPLFRGLVKPDFQGIKSFLHLHGTFLHLHGITWQFNVPLAMGRVFRAYGALHERLPKRIPKNVRITYEKLKTAFIEFERRPLTYLL